MHLGSSFKDKNTSKLEGSILNEKIKEGFMEALLESVLSKNFNVKVVLNDESTSQLRKLFNPKELQEIKEEFLHVKDNLVATIQKLPR